MEQLIDSINSIKITSVMVWIDMLIAIAIILIFFLLRSVISKILIKIVYKIMHKSDEDVTKNPMFEPLKIFFSLLGVYIAIQVFPINSQVRQYSDVAFEVLVMLLVIKFFTSLITPNSAIFKFFLTKSKSNVVNNFICRIIQTIIWIIGIFIILYTQHINVSGLATGLGIGSAIIALAAQDVVKNVLCGIAILTDKPFVIGDWIIVGEIEGSVVDITFRSTRIKTVDTFVVTVPNEKIASENVINASKMKKRRINVKLKLDMSTPASDIAKITKRLKIVIESMDHVIKDSSEINLFELNDYSYDLKIYFYIDVIAYEEYLHIRQAVLCKIVDTIQKDGIKLAYPSQSLYLNESKVKNEDFLSGDNKTKKLSLKEAIANLSKLSKKDSNENE